MPSILSPFFLFFLGDGDSDLPPGTPPTFKFEGPWFSTQLLLSCSIGFVSFLTFSYSRTRYPLMFAPRTKLTGFSPHEAHAHQAFFGWILPTIRTSEFTVLQIVGLDAAVLLSFFKMSFYLFSVCSFFAIAILMPINWRHNKELLSDPEWDLDWSGDLNNDFGEWSGLLSSNSFLERPSRLSILTAPNSTIPADESWLGLFTDATTYLSVHLAFTYLFTITALYFIYKNYRRFIRTRQLFSLELVHSISARTILITRLPRHLQGERPLAEYFEGMNMAVESVSIVREVGSLKRLLDQRTKALLELESAWVSYVGNPSTVEEYDPESSAAIPSWMGDDDLEPGITQAQRGRLVVPHRKRPTLRPGWFSPKVDALEYLEKKFRDLDELVKRRRRIGRFRATQTAFVTFEKMSSAQSALQIAHAPNPFQCKTYPAPEPRDIVWSNMIPTENSMYARDIMVLAALGLLFFTWFFPITVLASLLSYDEIKRTLPWLADLINQNEKIQAIVQNSLPSVAMITLNALLPFMLEGLTYLQGYRARSWVEYSLLKKYHLFLLVNVVFIFLVVSTYWALVRDLANFPAKIPEKLAKALQSGKARNFFLSYVILQGLGIMPLQLLNLGVLIPQFLMRMFFTRTPRDYAELNAPPMINYGVVYPQAILMFTITILYSVVQPLILIFGAIYFGMAYVVYKYKLLFVFYKPYESQGQAWPITYIRLIWGVIIFLVFMTGFFLVSKAFILSSFIVPLLGGTLIWMWYLHSVLTPLSRYVNLSSVYEVERGEESEEVSRLRSGHPVTWSQTNLNRRRYAQNDETLYVAPEDERTDYSQPPMANWYNGVLNTGKRRYGHPALTGVLPEPWLPLKKGQTLSNSNDRERGARNGGTKDLNQAVVLTLRKRPSIRKASRTLSAVAPNDTGEDSPYGGSRDVSGMSSNPWEDTQLQSTSSPMRASSSSSGINHRLSFDQATGIIMLPDDQSWLGPGADDSEDDNKDEDYGTFERQRRISVVSPQPTAARNPSHDAESGVSTGSEEGTPTPITMDTSLPPSTASPSRTSRYGTYFHHPERRRSSQIPGAFPRT
ncbi:hypothetical protein E1B28_005902 [Marasmius oreades]|uniref:DUF221-domain-containing protein n=1 Tax=Marasmius oreades TaxID=181124 RepID=A0A9P7UV21_9AGAR|nr:uncharacterized protein E1B28_005902 [Marasmius oreades]KAG7095118.1 hypothetical protein E1B28_005902 [Marasmius oreades]